MYPTPIQEKSLAIFSDFLRSGRAQAVYLAVFLEGFLVWGSATYLAAFGRLVDAGRYELAFALSAVGLVAVGIGTALAGGFPKR